MPIDIKKFYRNVSIILACLIINNYILISLSFFGTLVKINLIIFFLLTIYFYIKHFKTNLPLKVYFLLILVIWLGTSVTGWDARSLYLFHAKRIFFDNSIYLMVDNYAQFSHNDYPLLVQSLTASFALLVGYWHEIFPKTAYAFMYLPPLIFLSTYLNYKKYIIFLSLIIFFLGNHIFNIGADGVLAAYFITSAYCFFIIFFKDENDKRLNFITLLFCIILSLIKNEGLVLLVLIFFSTLTIKIFEKNLVNTSKKISFFLISFVPIIAWKIYCYSNGVSNTDFSFSLLTENFIGRAIQIESYELFLNYFILSNEKSLIAISVFFTSLYLNFNKKLFYFTIILFLSYLLILVLVYFSTPYDLTYHLETSAHRILKSLTLLLSFFALYNLNLKSLK